MASLNDLKHIHRDLRDVHTELTALQARLQPLHNRESELLMQREIVLREIWAQRDPVIFEPGEQARVKSGFCVGHQAWSGRVSQISDGDIVVINHASSPDYSTYDVTTGGKGGIGQGSFPALFLEKIG